MMPSTARPVVTVEESLMLSSGSRPVRINHRPSRIIPRFLPAKLDNAIFFSQCSVSFFCEISALGVLVSKSLRSPPRSLRLSGESISRNIYRRDAEFAETTQRKTELGHYPETQVTRRGREFQITRLHLHSRFLFCFRLRHRRTHVQEGHPLAGPVRPDR